MEEVREENGEGKKRERKGRRKERKRKRRSSKSGSLKTTTTNLHGEVDSNLGIESKL